MRVHGASHRVTRLVIFDLDGTLIDSRRDIATATNHALRAVGFVELSEERIVSLVGDGARSLLARAAAVDESDPAVDALLSAFVAHYRAHPVEQSSWIPGAHEALEALGAQGVVLALCTNKARPVAEAVIESLGIASHFTIVYAGGDPLGKKPDPRPLLWIAERASVSVEASVMVGDGPQDVLAARGAGMRSVGIVSGYAPQDRLLAAKPDVVLPDLWRLPALLTDGSLADSAARATPHDGRRGPTLVK